MDYPVSRSVVPELRVLASSPSTNSELLSFVGDPGIRSLTTVLTLDQTAGRGRLDRSWVAPAGTALALSVLVRDALAHPLASWLPLLAGLTLAEALDEIAPGRVQVKWPNDLLLEERKVCGILVEVAPGGDVVIGSGLNLAQTAEQLPVATATSLALAGIPLSSEQLDTVIAGYLRRLRGELEAPGPTSRLRERVAARCATIGRAVSVLLADGSTLEGTATGLDAAGRLEVASAAGGTVAVAVGDVTHARLA
ncbi:biotin--[acetyl-CoA-carboxylase] ligase [Pseudolysinimonas sp.]|jgi:BirA family biotin operon repressor/biotin-[acetyl-CoA-carboxylase] ligase|uniref:biotin--[acetyl-CoA-carboxylase] ligase n=1 Tax=Pseudolysinimonas sp. TaxID=2680009 RepID=UPI0037838086